MCLLGAGSCHDVDLGRLGASYRTLYLVDLDRDAIGYGLQQQSFEATDQLRIGGPYDVTGWFQEDCSTAMICDALCQNHRRTCDSLRRPSSRRCAFSVIDQSRSCNALSAVNGGCLWEGHRGARSAFGAIVVRLGGVGVLVADFVSTSTCPELLKMAAPHVSDAAANRIARGNHFTALNPSLLAHDMRRNKWGSVVSDRVVLVKPWKWAISDNRAYAVTMFRSKDSNVTASDTPN